MGECQVSGRFQPHRGDRGARTDIVFISATSLPCQQSMGHDKDQERGGGHNFAENGQVHNY